MASPERFVIDTNVIISFLLFYQSVPGQAVTKALRTGIVLRSDSTLSELARVLERPKFDRYLTDTNAWCFSNGLSRKLCM